MKIEYAVKVEQDDCPLEGNVLACGDDAEDKRAEDAVRARLDRGDVYAWCWVKVTARCEGFFGVASVGGVSVEDEAGLEKHILFDLRAEARHALVEELRRESGPALVEARLRASKARRVLAELRRAKEVGP